MNRSGRSHFRRHVRRNLIPMSSWRIRHATFPPLYLSYSTSLEVMVERKLNNFFSVLTNLWADEYRETHSREELDRIRALIASGHYSFKPMYRYYVPKSGGRLRPIPPTSWSCTASTSSSPTRWIVDFRTPPTAFDPFEDHIPVPFVRFSSGFRIPGSISVQDLAVFATPLS